MSSLYVLLHKGKVVGVAPEQPHTGTPKMKEFPGMVYDEAKQNGWDYKSFAEAKKIAEQLTKVTGKTWMPYNNGSGTSNQFGVMQPPALGDDVSRGFNGDYYPCGKIVRVTPTLRVTAQDEHGHKVVFNRVKETSSWRQVGGTWWMVAGIHDERNPHF